MPLNQRIYILFLLLVFLTGASDCFAFAAIKANPDSTKKPSLVSDTLNVQEYYFQAWIYSPSGLNRLNVSDRTHSYHPYYFRSLFRNDLGNIGSADHVVLLDHNQPFGFNFRNERRIFWKKLLERPILVSPKMFSNVNYTNGANRENHLVTNLTRGFGKPLNLGFSFKRINSEGFYDRQQSIFTNLSIYATFKTKNEKYKAAVIFDYSDLEVEENGGLQNDSTFELNLSSGRSFIPVNLNASSNKWKGFDVGLEQRLILSKAAKDSLVSDRYFHPAISHSFSASRYSMIYKGALDTVLNFYHSIYSDSLLTYDSTNILGVKNSLRFEFVKSDSVETKVLGSLKAGIGHEYYRVSYDSIHKSINNLSVLLNASGQIKQFDWEVDGKLMLFGENIWDTRLSALFQYKLGQSAINGSILYSLYNPDFISTNYVSNHFVWNNSWSQTSHLRAEINYTQTRLRLYAAVQYHLLDKLVAFGTDRLPYQSHAANQILIVKAAEHFKMRWFHLILEGAAQFKLTGDDIRIPMFLGRGLFYYQNDIFKRRLRLQIGVETSYATSYYANAYNPALSGFHMQNDRQVGNYPFIDVFLNLRIKKFRAFVKVEHINAGWLGYTYYHVPHYPANDLAWKFGVNWAFLD